ncbi:uncharacterized protein LOC135826552 [Sycon ciliatum]|uniref:uncharacterized protein LOC135826552 n=1 Tax=Sycon ciliatum TaxID=27933 RepID=UPI0020AD7715|eukprot:scpid77136/ scgid18966/ 
MNRQHDPWDAPEFISKHYLWIMTLDPLRLRSECINQGLLDNMSIIPTLQAMQNRGGPDEHNSHLLSYIRPGGRDSYMRFLEVVTALGFHHVRAEMDQLLMPPGATTRCVEESGKLTPTPRPIPKISRALIEIVDLDDFAKQVRMYLGDYQCEQLAKLMVKQKGGYLNNYRSIVVEWMREHYHGRPEITNLPGLMAYFVDQPVSPTCNLFLTMIKDVAYHTAQHVEKVIESTTFTS